MLKVTHFQISRWGSSTIHWSGTEDELNEFREWVKKTIPTRHYSFAEDHRDDPDMIEHYKTNACINFDLTAWVFACYWWAPNHAPAIGQEWKPASNIEQCQWEAEERGLPIETVYFHQHVSLPEEARDTAMRALNKAWTGAETIPLDKEVPAPLVDAVHDLCRAESVRMGVDIYVDGSLEFFKP